MWHSPFYLPFLSYENLTILIILFSNTMLPPDIYPWYTSYQGCVFIILRIYLSLLNCSGINISIFCFLLSFASAIFAKAPSLARLLFFLSLLNILNIFGMLLYCYHHWLVKINAPGSVHSSKLILCSYHYIVV